MYKASWLLLPPAARAARSLGCCVQLVGIRCNMPTFGSMTKVHSGLVQQQVAVLWVADDP